MKIGNVSLASEYAIAPMAGMTDTAFRRLVKRQGGCGLVVTEMVSAEGLVRGIDRTLRSLAGIRGRWPRLPASCRTSVRTSST
jgi:tRNA-dihydrouridine synthase